MTTSIGPKLIIVEIENHDHNIIVEMSPYTLFYYLYFIYMSTRPSRSKGTPRVLMQTIFYIVSFKYSDCSRNTANFVTIEHTSYFENSDAKNVFSSTHSILSFFYLQ